MTADGETNEAPGGAGGMAAAVAALKEALPELRDAPVADLGGGLDHHAVRVGEVVLRLRGDDDEPDVTREIALLELVRRRVPIPVPAPVAAGDAWIAYPLLAGISALTLDPQLRAGLAGPLAASLGEVLARLWATPRAEVEGLAEDDRTPLAEWRDEAAELAADLADELPEPVRRGLERFFAAPLPPAARARVFSHNDLGCEHVLVEPEAGAITGIIDWSDAAVVDPAKDLGLILRDLGPEAFERAWQEARAGLPAADDPTSRARLYAHCLALEDLAFGLETGRTAYVRSARDALARLTAESAG